MRYALSPRGAVRGAIAGLVGTAAMDLVWYSRYQRGGGTQRLHEWEFSSGLTWDTAPAPAQVGKQLAEGVLGKELPPESAPLVNNAVHWGTGVMWGAVYGAVAAAQPTPPSVACGGPFGEFVCLTSYAVLPLMKLYKPIWQYDARTLAKDFSAHLAYGLGTSVACALLSRGRRSPSPAT